MRHQNGVKAICFLLALIILFPKMLLVDYTINTLWGNFGLTELLYVFVQDIMLALIFYNLLTWIYIKNKQSILLVSFFISTLMITFLMLDARVRELWLVPISFDLIQYTVKNYKDLMSGTEVFLNYYAGLGMTFRRAFFIVVVVFTTLFLILIKYQRAEFVNTKKYLLQKTVAFRYFSNIVLFSVLFLISMVGKNVIYATQENPLTSPIIKSFNNSVFSAKKREAVSFEQPLRHLTSQVPRDNSLNSVELFKNVIIVILESTRYKEFTVMHERDTAFHMPFLKKVASEGLFQKCYVSVPHTSKAQFAIISGRNPYPDIEMRETLIGEVPSIVSLLKKVKGSNSYFITVQNLNFENTSGMVKALGFENIYGPDDFSKNKQVIASSSFGLTDNTLLSYPFEQIKKKESFFITFMTNGAHYPYGYPNKIHQDATDVEEYLKSEGYLDKFVGRLFDRLDRIGLLEDTLVVIVGDHGESFGEHGTYIHNSSMFEEEVTVPLIFWAKNTNKLKGVQMRQAGRQIDIAPTIAEFFGINESKEYILQGNSLIKHDNQKEMNYPAFISTFFRGTSQAIVNNKEKLILNFKDKRITKFDLEKDPAELRGINLTGQYYNQNMARFQQFSDYHNSVFSKLE